MPLAKELQIGKNKLNDGFIQELKRSFEKYKSVRISVLKSARENKKDVKIFADEILKNLGENYTARVIGFVIVIKKWRKNRNKI